MLTFDGEYVYGGKSTYTSDIVYTIKGDIPIVFIVMLL